MPKAGRTGELRSIATKIRGHSSSTKTEGSAQRQKEMSPGAESQEWVWRAKRMHQKLKMLAGRL